MTQKLWTLAFLNTWLNFFHGGEDEDGTLRTQEENSFDFASSTQINLTTRSHACLWVPEHAFSQDTMRTPHLPTATLWTNVTPNKFLKNSESESHQKKKIFKLQENKAWTSMYRLHVTQIYRNAHRKPLSCERHLSNWHFNLQVWNVPGEQEWGCVEWLCAEGHNIFPRPENGFSVTLFQHIASSIQLAS